MTLLLHIFRFKFLSFLKSTFDFRAVTVVRGIGSLMVFGGFGLGAYVLSRQITGFVLEETQTGLFLYHRFISMMLFVFFVAVNLGNIIVSYSTLYRSTEVYYLLTKPVSYTQIFILKFLDNFLYSSATLFLVAFMVLLGYGSYFGYPWYFFAGVMFLVLIPFMFLAACLAVLILMGIMKIAGRLGFRKVMSALFGVYFFFIFLFFKYSNPVKLVEQVNRYYPHVDQYLSRLTPGFLQYLPNHWVSEFLFYTARGEPGTALPYAALLVTVTLTVFLICIAVARRFYYRSWMVSLTVQAHGAMPYDPDRVGLIDFRRSSVLPGPLEVLLTKEYFSFFREPSQWIHLVVMVVLTGIFVMSIGNLNLRLRVADVQLLTYLVMFAFGGFLVSSLALRFVFPMVSLEGNAFWAVRSAPVSEGMLYAIKFIIVFAVVLTLAELVAVASNIPFVRFSGRRPLLLWFGVYQAFWMSLAVVSLNLAMGGYFSNFNEKNPIRLASSQGATLTFLFTILYLIATVVVVILPLNSYFQSLFIFTRFDLRSIVIPGTILGVLATAIAGFGLAVGLRSLKRDF